MPHYFIDALDPSGSSAFVSLREEGLLWTNSEVLQPAWYLSAPDFVPTPVSSRAIGFAATMRGQQIGLSVDGETEVPFMTLEAVTAFTERLYLAGGGPGGGDGPTPPPAPEGGEPPDLPPLPELGDSMRITARILSRADAIAEFSKSLNSKEGRTSALIEDGSPEDVSDGDMHLEFESIVRHAVNVLAAALLERRPQISDATYSRWLRSVNIFKRLIFPLELRRMLSRIHYDELDYLFDDSWDLFSAQRLIDPLDLLAQLPLLSAVVQGEDWNSLADLFFGCVSVPSKLTAGYVGKRRCYLMYFAAFILVKDLRRAEGASPLHSHPELVSAEAREVLIWLLNQMPDHAFAPEIETILESQRRAT